MSKNLGGSITGLGQIIRSHNVNQGFPRHLCTWEFSVVLKDLLTHAE